MTKTYGRGSEWRRWDLHIHAPGTALNDQFGDWDEYLNAIEAAADSIAVIGVTDYFTLRSYKRIIAYRERGRLPNIALIVPNIEFRLTPVTAKGKAINIHLLISPDAPDHVTRIDEALAKLTIDRDNDSIPCTEEGLRRLGRRMRPELSSDPDAAFTEGVEQFKIGLDLFQQWWRSQAWIQRNSLIAVANSSFDGASGLQHDDGLKDTRAEIYRFSHIIFSARGLAPKTIAAWNLHVETLEKAIQLDGAIKKQILESQGQEQRLTVELARIVQEFKWLAETYPAERQRKQDERRAHYLEFFDLLAEEQAILVELYRHLSASLAGKGQHEQKLELVCRVEIDLKSWVERGESLFDLRRQGPFQDGLPGFARSHIEGPWRSCDKDAVGTGIDALIELIKEPDLLRSQLRANVTLLSVAEWLFSVDLIGITYGIRYDGKDLRLLSPGTKASCCLSSTWRLMPRSTGRLL